MKYFVDQGLFENSHGTITCLKLAKRLDKSMTSNPEMRSIIQSLKKPDNHDQVMTESEIVMQDETRLEEIKVNTGSSGDEKKGVLQDEQKTKRNTQLPKDFKPNQNNIETAEKSGVDINYQLQQFTDYHLAKGSKFKDWNRAFNTWIRKSAEFNRGSGYQGQQPQQARSIRDL